MTGDGDTDQGNEPEGDAPKPSTAARHIPVEDVLPGLIAVVRQAGSKVRARLDPVIARLPDAPWQGMGGGLWHGSMGSLSLWALRIPARRGNVAAQRELGYRLANGEASLVRQEEAFQWFRHGAAQGDAPCQYALGVMYATGQGVAEGKLQAVTWYRKAAEQGHSVAQFNLALMYDTGDGIDRDLDAAFRWYTASADQGYPQASFNLGIHYETGDGCGPDLKLALDCYARAAELGFVPAQLRLARAYLGEGEAHPNPVDAWVWFSTALTHLPPGDDADLAENGREAALALMTLAEIEAARRRLREKLAPAGQS